MHRESMAAIRSYNLHFHFQLYLSGLIIKKLFTCKTTVISIDARLTELTFRQTRPILIY